MTSLFEERERAFEAKWAHDEEMQFRVVVRRNELLGLWAAEELGLRGAEKEHYVAELVAMGLKNKDATALFKKLRADMSAAHSDAVILRQMDDFLRAASLDVGLEQRHSLDDGKGRRGKRASAQFDFSRMLEQDDTDPQRKEETHLRMLRKISTRGTR
jgi:hypothetical protein